MIKLPPNKPQKTVDTPSNFFLYGESMHGKSYLAGEFPNPLFISTDGNAKANPFPSIEVKNIRNKQGKIDNSILDQLDQIVLLLQTTKHTYETIVIDVIDDVVSMIEQYFCDREGVEVIGDIPFGKGHAAVKSIVTQLAIDLKSLPMNVIYVSRFSSFEEDGVITEVPSLPVKFVNIINGNCDYKIQAKKIGKNYIRVTRDKRKNYQRENIDDDRILNILDTVTGAFEKSQKTNKNLQEKIVKKMEEDKEAKLIGEKEHEEADDEVEVEPVKEEVIDKQPTKPTPEEVKQVEEEIEKAVPTKPVPTEEVAVENNNAQGFPTTTRKRPVIK